MTGCSKTKGAFRTVHLIADLEAPKKMNETPAAVKKLLWGAAKAANNTPLKASVYKFPVQGITGVVILAESHIAIHTWPEHNHIALDIFTCGENTRPYAALEFLKNKIKPTKVRVKLLKRGL